MVEAANSTPHSTPSTAPIISDITSGAVLAPGRGEDEGEEELVPGIDDDEDRDRHHALAASGRITLAGSGSCEAPSTIAASSSSRGIWSMKVRITIVPSETKKAA